MPRNVVFPLLAVSVAALLGCSPERAPSHEQIVEQHDAVAVAKAKATPLPAAAVTPEIDDANLILNACGRPGSDQVIPIYDKLNNGPVRRMVYRGNRQLITLNFVPSRALTATAGRVPVELAPGSVWRFHDAYMEHEEMLISRRLHIYLPCAAAALSPEV